MESPAAKRKGSPQKFFTKEGQCHRMSPNSKKQRELKPSQVDIKKSVVQFFDATDLEGLIKSFDATNLEGLIKAAVTEAMEKERKRNLIFEDDVKRNLVTDITLRSVVSEWSKTSFGKDALQRMIKTINQNYDEGVKAKQLPYAHKVSHGDLLSDMKQWIKRAETNDAAKKFLDSARVAIEASSRLPGSEFLELISGYAQANEQAHVIWSPEKLQHVLDLTKEDRLQICGHTPTLWIREMVQTIAKDRGWVLDEGL